MVAHRRDVGPSSLRQLAERHAIFAAFSDPFQRGVQQPGPRPQTGLATLVRSRSFHATYSIICLKSGQASAALQQSGADRTSRDAVTDRSPHATDSGSADTRFEFVQTERGDGSECPGGVDVSGGGFDGRPRAHLETECVAVDALELDGVQLAAVLRVGRSET